ncbi:MAG TPA: SDR family NAD(P)-dependent oxidoreductase [Isosphaeraceae bacterium]
MLTGASSGIGAALARELARRGYGLALTARRADRLTALAEECRRLGAVVAVLPADLADTEVAARLVSDTVAAFGRLDALINNAGYGLPAPFAEVEPADIVRQLDVNLVTPILLAKYALPHLVASRGTVINVGSSLSAIAVPAYGVYGTTKMGIAYWNDALRREVRGSGVHVCLVEPGPVSTDFFDAAAGPTGVMSSPWQMVPPPFAKARPDDVARRIARLIDRPRRRLSVLRRVVWPTRLMGALFRTIPALGDLAIGGVMRARGAKRADRPNPTDS